MMLKNIIWHRVTEINKTYLIYLVNNLVLKTAWLEDFLNFMY